MLFPFHPIGEKKKKEGEEEETLESLIGMSPRLPPSLTLPLIHPSIHQTNEFTFFFPSFFYIVVSRDSS